MKTEEHADTRAASAVASAVESSDLESGFLPEDAEYRKTGKFSDQDEKDEKNEQSTAAEKQDEQEQDEKDADTQDASAAATEEENADTAAASAAASTQEHEKNTGKSSDKSENRYRKLSRENRELREKLARLEGREEGRSSQTRRDTEQDSPPAAEKSDGLRPEPKPDDVDPKTGKGKYASYGEYDQDWRKWVREAAAYDVQQATAKSQRQQELERAEQTIQQEMGKRADKARQAYSDYDEVSQAALEAKDNEGRELIFFPKGSAIDQFLLTSERSHDVLYQIFRNLDTHAHIFARKADGSYVLNPFQQVRALLQIEAALPDAAKPASAKPVTRAPRPPNQVDGKNAVTKSARDQAIEEGDADTYMRDANASDPRLAAVRASRKKG